MFIHESLNGIIETKMLTNTPNPSVLVPLLLSCIRLFPMRRGKGVIREEAYIKINTVYLSFFSCMICVQTLRVKLASE